MRLLDRPGLYPVLVVWAVTWVFVVRPLWRDVRRGDFRDVLFVIGMVALIAALAKLGGFEPWTTGITGR